METFCLIHVSENVRFLIKKSYKHFFKFITIIFYYCKKIFIQKMLSLLKFIKWIFVDIKNNFISYLFYKNISQNQFFMFMKNDSTDLCEGHLRYSIIIPSFLFFIFRFFSIYVKSFYNNNIPLTISSFQLTFPVAHMYGAQSKLDIEVLTYIYSWRWKTFWMTSFLPKI